MVDQHDTLFLGYIEGDLTPEQVQEFENILVQDARLRNLVAQLVIDRSRLRRLTKEDAPPELMERVNQQIERRMLLNGSLNTPTNAPGRLSPEHRFHLNRYMAYAGVAAMVAITALAVVWTLRNPAVQHLADKRSHEALVAPSESAGQLANAQGGREPNDSLRSNRALDETEPQPRPLTKSLSAAAPSPAARTPESKTNDGLPALGESQNNANSQALPSPPSAAQPVLKSRPLFEDQKQVTTPAPAANTQTPPTNPNGQTALAGVDRPVPAAQPNSTVFFQMSGVRLEVASPWPDVSRREVLAWATRHGAQVVPREAPPSQVKAEEETKELARDKDATAAEAGQSVVLLIVNKEVPDLVAFLNTQRGQSASMTQVVTTDGAAMADHASQVEWRRVGGEVAATQPTTAPAGPSGTETGTLEAAKKADVEQQPAKRVKVPAEIVVLPNGKNAVMRLEVVIEQAGPDR